MWTLWLVGQFLVFPFEGNLDSATLQDAYILFVSELRRQGAVEAMPSSPDSDVYTTDRSLVDLAHSREKCVVHIQILRFRERLLLLARTAYPDRDTLRVDRITLDGVEDLETSLPRLVRALTRRTSYEETAEVGRITRYEQFQSLQRNWTLTMLGVGMSRVAPLLHLQHQDPYTGSTWWASWNTFELMYAAEGTDMDLRFALSFSSYYTQTMFLAHRILRRTATSLYVGGGVGYTSYAWSDFETMLTHGNNGMTLIGTLGIQWMRTYNAHAYTELRVFTVLNSMLDSGLSLGFGLMFSS